MDFKMLPVDRLMFDPQNPRLPTHVDQSDEQEVLEWMLQDAGLVELMGSIAVNGYFAAEPLLVLADNDSYLVLEGNRRLAAVKLLLEPDRAPARKIAVQTVAGLVSNTSNLKTLPCAVFHERGDVLDYLGYRHITGIKQWSPAAKARYLHSLYEEHSASAGEDVYRRIARIIGSRSDYVMRLLGALRLYQQAFGAQPNSVESEDLAFSLLTLALNYASIVEYLELESMTQDAFGSVAPNKLTNLTNWLYKERPELGRTQLGESRNMKLLAAAVTHQGGLDALERGETVEEAVQATLDASSLFTRSLRLARERLVTAQALLHRADTSSALPILDELEDLLDQIALAARRRARRTERDNVQ